MGNGEWGMHLETGRTRQSQEKGGLMLEKTSNLGVMLFT